MLRTLSGVFLAFFLLLGAQTSASASTANEGNDAPYRIVAGTEHIADTVRDLLGGKVEILTLIPPSSCPGHHDIRASEMAFFSKAQMVILHHWQKDYPGIKEAVQAAKLPKEAVKLTTVGGSLLVPENQLALGKEISAFLGRLPGQDGKALRERLEERRRRINGLAKECKEQMAPHRGSPAYSALMQQEFVRWTGLNVIGTYGRAEDLSPALLMELASKGKRAGVAVVADNLQSGADAGLPLAKEIGAAHAVLSNFPGFAKEAPDYESLLRHNVQALQNALTGRSEESGAKREGAGPRVEAP